MWFAFIVTNDHVRPRTSCATQKSKCWLYTAPSATCGCFASSFLPLRGTIVNRTCGKHKNLPVYIQPFLLTIFVPINYGPPLIRYGGQEMT